MPENLPNSGPEASRSRSGGKIRKFLNFPAFWERPGSSSEALGRVLEPPWVVWGRLGNVLAHVRSGLEAYSARLGSFLARP